jgi:predicted SAM-dependent methyltransferase
MIAFLPISLKLQLTKFRATVKASLPRQYIPTIIKVYYSLRTIVYIGNQVICPCCEGHFRTFISYRNYGGKLREKAICPRCSSVERHRLLWLYLKNKTNLFTKNLKVLHFAPEYYFQKRFASLEKLDYVSVDLASPLAEVKMDITSISYGDNFFDVILCNHVLEHIPDDRKAMQELFRVLKPGGWAILQVPIDLNLEQTFEDPSIVSPEDRERLFGQYDHVRLYGRDYKNKLEQAGFQVKVDEYVRSLGTEIIKKYGLKETEDIYFCTK